MVFDTHLSVAQRAAIGPRYDFVWGATYPSAWYTNNHALIASKYSIPVEDFGLGQDFASHPDWILYNCTSDGTPTHIPAYMQAGAYGKFTPVDIHNPALISDAVHRMAAAAIAGGYNALAVDQVTFYNFMGGNAGAGSYGCGVWQGNTFVKRYTSKRDRNWGLDLLNWVKTAKYILTHDAAIAPHHLKLAINHPSGSVANPIEQELLANVDMHLNEEGFSNYGSYTKEPTHFATVLNSMIYEQAHGVTALIIDRFARPADLTATEREWVVGTYIMANNGNALMYAGHGRDSYGQDYQYPEYGIDMGAPCSGVTGGPAIYERRFANGLVVVNADIATHSASLPLVQHYSDIEGRPVTNPLTVPPTDAFVLTTVARTGCL